MSSAMGRSSFKFAAAQDLNDLAKELGSVSSFKTKVFKYFLKLDQKQHGCTAKQHFFLFVVFLYCCIYIHCISLNFVIRLRLILQIFSIHISFICFFLLLLLLITSWSTLRTESPSIFLDQSGRGRNLSRFLFPDLSRKDRSDSASRVQLVLCAQLIGFLSR